MTKPKRHLDLRGKQERADEAKSANAREKAIAETYLNAGPSIGNLARAAYHWYNSVPWLGGQNESGLILQTGEAPNPGMRSPKAIVKGLKFITKTNAAKITPAQWTAAQDAAIARGDMTEAQRLRDLHFKVNAPNTKAIDVSGKPLSLYHGTGKKFNYFDDNKIGTNYLDLGYYGKGHYFTPSKEAAEGYASVNNNPVVYKVYGNFKNPKVISIEDESMIGQAIKNNDSVIAGLDDLDYSEYVAKTGNQIKSADAVTYDNNGVRIPLGERDNFNINDIRYAFAPIVAGGIGYGVYRNQKRDGGSIYISPSKRGTFTAAATKHGMGVQEFASKILRNKEDYSPSLVKKANFARNASKWH